MRTALAIAFVALFLAVVEVRGQQEKVVEVEEEDGDNPGFPTQHGGPRH